MNIDRIFKKTLRVAIVLVYIVIIAGAVVRMTGSGMGCPDWPKCFGYLIPPTQKAQLEWQPNHNYQKGQVIIKNEALRVVKNDFISVTNYNENNWTSYQKHDYAIFNPVHTWVEYINRLATVLFGIPILLLVIFSFSFWKKNKAITILALASLFSVAFEAWLGKIVVDTNLLPIKITLHVLFVFFILAFLLALQFISSEKNESLFINKSIKYLGVLTIILTLTQVILGTQVRQFVDHQMTDFNYELQENWLTSPPFIFYIHRSFSILLVVTNLIWIYLYRKQIGKLNILKWVGIFIILEVCTGMVLYYLDFPFLSQPLHLLLGSLLFSVQFYAVLQQFYNKTLVHK
ncbi:COX15/CtaA family protein [Aquimarina agarilytica]|uniref:COX15/CtaA family protein n=1 Tax=Aquimarina agarilytica TaxID=1087449 RepID=UPI000287E45B|nr:COX15/CtaA family protein [Aquimarina agarilytica]